MLRCVQKISVQCLGVLRGSVFSVEVCSEDQCSVLRCVENLRGSVFSVEVC